MDQWQMDENDPFHKRIYKLGHRLNENYDKILAYTGSVNKEFSSKENHRHMSMRQPKCLRRSNDFLIPVGPFMDKWGEDLGKSSKLELHEKAEIVGAFYEGYKRQDQAFGYIRAFKSLVDSLEGGLSSLEQYLPFDVFAEIKKSKFMELSLISKEEFEQDYRERLEKFTCPVTNLRF